MKKLFFLFAAICLMTACSPGNGEGSAAGDEAAPALELKLQKAFTGTTGNNFKAFDAFAVSEIPFELKENGENVDVSTTFKIKRTEEPAKSVDGVTEVWISYTDEAKNEHKIELRADEASQKAIEEAMSKPAGEEVELTFKGVAKKADIEAMNGQKTVNTFVCR